MNATDKLFDLAKAMANGGRCQTRDGRPARIICENPIVALITDAGEEWPLKYDNDGRLDPELTGSDDLVNSPVKREGWVNVVLAPNNYRITQIAIYDTQEGARAAQAAQDPPGAPLACARIEWEEPA